MREMIGSRASKAKECFKTLTESEKNADKLGELENDLKRILDHLES
jgi:hypothetical protein